MSGAEFTPFGLLGLRWPSTRAYRLFGGANGGLQEGSCQGLLPRTSAASVLVPVVSHSHTLASAGDLPTLVGRSDSVSYGVTASSPWVLMYTLLSVCPPRVESLFLPVLLKSCNQIPLTFKVWFSGNSSSHCWTPTLGSLTWGSEPSLQWVDYCGIIVLKFVSHHPAVMGFDFIVIVPLLPSHCGFSFVFGCGVSFLVSSSVFLLMIVQQLVVIPVLSQEGVSTCPTLPSWTNLKLVSS